MFPLWLKDVERNWNGKDQDDKTIGPTSSILDHFGVCMGEMVLHFGPASKSRARVSV